MNKNYCQKIRISAMAILDGEEPQLSAEKINEHLQSCADCRHELERQKQIVNLLGKQKRREFQLPNSNYRIPITEISAGRLTAENRKSKIENSSLPFVALGLILFTYKIIEVLPGVTAGLAIKSIPLVVIIVFFSLLKQNPFKINQNLTLEGDIR